MADFTGLIITERGQNLLALAQAGTGIHFSHVECGSGEWAESQNPEKLTGLVHTEKTLAIQDIKTPGDGSTTVSVFLTNSDLEAGFFFREIGLFASDPNNPGSKILYAVSYSGDRYDFIPARGGTLAEELINLMTIVGNASQVSAMISGTVVIATKQNIEEHDQDQAAHPGLRVQTPSLIVLGSDSVNEGDPVAIGVQGYVPGVWDLEAKLVVEDADGNEISDPFGLVWSMATGTATGTAPEVEVGGASYRIKAQLWEHGLIRNQDWASPVIITVGDVPVNQPEVSSPVEGQSGIGETPTIEWTYSADDGRAQEAAEVRFATDCLMQNVIHTATLGAVTSYETPAEVLTADGAFFVDVRNQAGGVYSPWSVPVGFYTAASFAVVNPPQYLYPAAGATDLGDGWECQYDGYSHTGAGNYGGIRLNVVRIADDVIVWDSGWLGPVNTITVPTGVVAVSTGYRLETWRRDGSDPAVESLVSAISVTTAATFSDAGKWAAWDESAENTLATDNTYVCIFENPVAGGNEIGMGGGLPETDRIVVQSGNVPGAAGTPPSRAVASPQGLAFNSASVKNLLQGTAFSWIFKINGFSATSNYYFSMLVGGVESDDWGFWFGEPDARQYFYIRQGPPNYANVPSFPVCSGDLWVAVWYNGTTLRAGYTYGAKPTKLSDFPANQICSIPCSLDLTLNSEQELQLVQPVTPYSYEFGGVHYVVASRHCLIDSNN